MATVRFDIPYPPTKKGKSLFCRRFGLNAYYSGKHWAQRKKDADELHALTLAAMRRAKVKKAPLDVPVNITFYFDDGLDCSNHAVIIKAVEDAMRGWVIRDDNRRCVKSIKAGFHEKNCISIVVEEAK